MIWHAIVTAPQAEFRVQEKLITLGARTLLPVEWHWRRIKNARPVPRKRPVIPGYVFAGFKEAPWWALSIVDGVRGVVAFNGRPAVIPASAIPCLAALERPCPSEPVKARKVQLGDRIRIKRGAFAELSAIVDGFEKGKVIAIVSLLGQQSRVTVEEDMVEAA